MLMPLERIIEMVVFQLGNTRVLREVVYGSIASI